MVIDAVPERLPNFIDGRESPAAGGEWFEKPDPHTGKLLWRAARSRQADVEAAVAAAGRAQPAWAETTPVARGDLLRAAALLLRDQTEAMARLVHRETGKSMKDARGETGAAVEQGMFVAGEGRRFYGHTTTSAVPNKQALIVRQPVGLAGLIVPANTPIANVAWKAFPALLCGNGVVLKSAEDTPAAAWAFARLLKQAGLPDGVFNVVHGLGEEAGAPLVDHPDVDLISFTGSCEVGRLIAQRAGARLARVCVELGGKNPLIVCDDADLPAAAESAVLSAFSNAGQRCAAGSRILVFSSVYDAFKTMLLERTRKLKVGPGDGDDLGPVINAGQLQNMLDAVGRARKRGASILCGGDRLTDPDHAAGYYMAPTWIENVQPDDELSRLELFGPISVLYRIRDFEEALRLANATPFGLTAAIHTASIHRAMTFLARIRAGVAAVNGATYGSEPHMPFGGLKQSGNGTREAGREALDVYSEWKTLYVNFKPSAV